MTVTEHARQIVSELRDRYAGRTVEGNVRISVKVGGRDHAYALDVTHMADGRVIAQVATPAPDFWDEAETVAYDYAWDLAQLASVGGGLKMHAAA